MIMTIIAMIIKDGMHERRKPRKLKIHEKTIVKINVYIHIPDKFSAEKHPKCK